LEPSREKIRQQIYRKYLPVTFRYEKHIFLDNKLLFGCGRGVQSGESRRRFRRFRKFRWLLFLEISFKGTVAKAIFEDKIQRDILDNCVIGGLEGFESFECCCSWK